MKFTKELAKKLAKQYLSEDELALLLIESIETVRRNTGDDELLFEELKKMEGFQEYLTNTMVKDKDRYFMAASPMEQLMIKGALNRTLYLRSKLREKKEVVKLDSPRHS